MEAEEPQVLPEERANKVVAFLVAVAKNEDLKNQYTHHPKQTMAKPEWDIKPEEQKLILDNDPVKIREALKNANPKPVWDPPTVWWH